MLIGFIILLSNMVFAADNQNIAEKMSNIWLSPVKDVDVLNNIKEANQEKMEEDIALYLIAPGYARQKIGISADDEKMKEQVRKNYEVFPNNILKMYYLNGNDYANQYANSECLEYLISDDYFLLMKGFSYKINDYGGAETVSDWPRRYGSDGTTEKYEQFRDEYGYSGGLSDECYEFLENDDGIKNILIQNSISYVEDMKVVVTGRESTCLYIKSSDDEYLIRLYTGKYYNPERDNPYNKDEDWVEELELLKLYNAKDFFKTVSDKMNEMNKTKPTYSAEAESLQAEGLLKGNENGLDLLRPLTRIEAATMLLRAMGEDETADASQVQTFSDVPSEHWGFGAAENAYSLGLVKGVGDDKFAPDESVTAVQFATMVLRAGAEPEFNWEEAINIMIDKGILTQENASTMDFFTRGDMAKIIYEARANGLL